MSFDPTEGLEEISAEDIQPGDEIFWKWESQQGLPWTHYVHARLPKKEGSEWQQKKAQEELDMIVTRNRTFYLVARH